MEDSGLANLKELADNKNETIRSTPIMRGEEACGTYVNYF